MSREDKSVWLIFFEGIKIYALNIHKFLLYMSFSCIRTNFGSFYDFWLDMVVYAKLSGISR